MPQKLKPKVDNPMHTRQSDMAEEIDNRAFYRRLLGEALEEIRKKRCAEKRGVPKDQ